jgi:acetoin utilization protein AcuC
MTMTDVDDLPPGRAVDVSYEPWQPLGEPSGTEQGSGVDRAIAATRGAIFPLYGLDPHDPRD